jgi:hypothetical protein
MPASDGGFGADKQVSRENAIGKYRIFRQQNEDRAGCSSSAGCYRRGDRIEQAVQRSEMKLYGSKGRTIDVELCLDTRLVAYGRALDPGRLTFAPSGPSGFRTYGPRPWGRYRETGEPCTASRRPGEPAHTAESPRYRNGRRFLRRQDRKKHGSTTLDRTTIDIYSYASGPSESKIGRRSKTEAPRAIAPARRIGEHPAHRRLFGPFLFTGVRSTWHHIAAIQRPAHPARRRFGGASDTGHRGEDDRTGTGYNPLAGSPGRQEARAPGTPFR